MFKKNLMARSNHRRSPELIYEAVLRKHLELTMKHGSRLVADFKLFLMCQLPIIWIEEVLILVTSGLRWPIYSIYALIKALFDEKKHLFKQMLITLFFYSLWCLKYQYYMTSFHAFTCNVKFIVFTEYIRRVSQINNCANAVTFPWGV